MSQTSTSDESFSEAIRNLGEERREKLDSLFENIVTKAAVDFNDERIEYFQDSVINLMDRAKQFINEQNGDLNISKIVPCGSLAEKKCIWKLSRWWRGLIYVECDFLAVLGRNMSITIVPGCSGCMHVELQPRFRTDFQQNGGCPQVILKDLGNALRQRLHNFLKTTMCDSIKSYRGVSFCMYSEHDRRIWYTLDSAFADDESVIHQRLKSFCQKSPNSSHIHSDLSKQLNVVIDFVPALELRDGTFLVAKPCTACHHGWRISGCRAEIDRLLHITDQQRKCYQVLKYFFQLPEVYGQNYHMKTAFLHHISVCSNTSNDCTRCVLEILRDIVVAYEKRLLKTFGQNSRRNLFAGQCSVDGWNEKGVRRLLTSLLTFDNWECLKTDLDINDCLDISAFDKTPFAMAR